MVTTYFLMSHPTWKPIADAMILRITDRNTVLVGTEFGCVFTTRQDAARLLREMRNRQRNPFVSDDGKETIVTTYTKTVTS